MKTPDELVEDGGARVMAEPSVMIQHTAYGRFFIFDDRNRVWDGEEWRGFGEAETYPTYPDAFRARRAAVARAAQTAEG